MKLIINLLSTYLVACISLAALLLVVPIFVGAEQKPFVIGRLNCQLGNNLFQVATTCAHAWDHGADPYFPDLVTKLSDGMPTNYAHMFFRCCTKMPKSPVLYRWQLPRFHYYNYCPIPYHPNMEIEAGTFQNEKFFAHHRKRLLNLFAPHPADLAYIKKKYAYILNHPSTVGVQMRWFGCKKDEAWWDFLIQYGYDYYDQAMSLFPEDTLFVVSCNDLEFARKNIPEWVKNVIFLEGEPYYIDFFILSLCKHNIISNSTFGWWAAWLNRNPNKIIVATQHWIDPKYYDTCPVDVWLKDWIRLDAKWGKPQDSITSFRKD